MAVALDNNAGYDGGGVSSLSFTVGSGSDRVLLVGIAYATYFGSISGGITYNGDAMTKEAEIDVITTDYKLEVYRLLNPDSGTNNIVIPTPVFGGFGYAGSVVASSWTGVHQTTPFGTITNNEGNSNSPTVTVDSTGADYVVDFDGIYVEVGAITAPQVLLNAVANNYDELNASSSYRAGTGGSFAMTRNTLTTNRYWGAIAVPLLPSGAASHPIRRALSGPLGGPFA